MKLSELNFDSKLFPLRTYNILVDDSKAEHNNLQNQDDNDENSILIKRIAKLDYSLKP